MGVLIKTYLDGCKTKFTYLAQILKGVLKVVLPLLFILVVAVIFKSKMSWIEENINLFIEAIGIILVCESVAIVINPLPKWAFDNNIDGIIDIADKIKKGK